MLTELLQFFIVIVLLCILVFRNLHGAPGAQLALCVGLVLRILFLFYHAYEAPVIGGESDALGFHLSAQALSETSSVGSPVAFQGWGSSYTWSLALYYSLVGPSLLLGGALSICAYVFLSFALYQLIVRFINPQSARVAMWALALFPVSIIYSILTMREMFIAYFVIMGVIAAISVLEKNSATHWLRYFGFFGLAGALHGGSLMLLFALPIFFLCSKKESARKKFFTFICVGCFIFGFEFFGLYVPYLGSFSQLLTLDFLQYKASVAYAGGSPAASYPSFLAPETGLGLVAMTPLRIIYFLGSPFIWDISKLNHILGYFDSLFYFGCSMFIFLSWGKIRGIRENKNIRIVMICLLIFILIHSIGVSNFGTAVRHRFKIFPILLFLSLFCFSYCHRLKFWVKS